MPAYPSPLTMEPCWPLPAPPLPLPLPPLPLLRRSFCAVAAGERGRSGIRADSYGDDGGRQTDSERSSMVPGEIAPKVSAGVGRLRQRIRRGSLQRLRQRFRSRRSRRQTDSERSSMVPGEIAPKVSPGVGRLRQRIRRGSLQRLRQRFRSRRSLERKGGGSVHFYPCDHQGLSTLRHSYLFLQSGPSEGTRGSSGGRRDCPRAPAALEDRARSASGMNAPSEWMPRVKGDGSYSRQEERARGEGGRDHALLLSMRSAWTD